MTAKVNLVYGHPDNHLSFDSLTRNNQRLSLLLPPPGKLCKKSPSSIFFYFGNTHTPRDKIPPLQLFVSKITSSTIPLHQRQTKAHRDTEQLPFSIEVEEEELQKVTLEKSPRVFLGSVTNDRCFSFARSFFVEFSTSTGQSSPSSRSCLRLFDVYDARFLRGMSEKNGAEYFNRVTRRAFFIKAFRILFCRN